LGPQLLTASCLLDVPMCRGASAVDDIEKRDAMLWSVRGIPRLRQHRGGFAPKPPGRCWARQPFNRGSL